MKVLLLHYADNKSKITEPLGICYIAAYLRSKNIETDILDSRIEGYELDEYTEKVIEISKDYGLIGISTSQLFDQKKETWAVQEIVNQLLESGYNGHITAGGYGPSINWKDFIEIGLDSIVYGEGEITLFNLVSALMNNHDWTQVKGLAYINDDGQKVINPPGDIPDFENLPFPTRDILDGFTKKYGVSQMNPLIQGSRGCYMKCAYCSTPVYLSMQGGPVYRNRSIKSIVSEIEILYNKGYRTFDFVDDNFLPPKHEDAIKRARELRDALKEKNIVASFYMEFRLEYISKEILEILKEVGVRKLLIGIESFNQQDLELYNRTYSTEKMHSAINAMLEAGYGADLNSEYRLRFGFINANPLSTIESLRNNAMYLKKYNFTYKKLITKLFLYNNNSIILKKVLEKYPEYSINNYFKDKRVEAFYEHYAPYDKKYTAIRNKGRNIEKYINKKIAANYVDLNYQEMLNELVIQRKELDSDVFSTYVDGLDVAEKDNYRQELKEFFNQRNEILNEKSKRRTALLDKCSSILGIEFYENEMFFN